MDPALSSAAGRVPALAPRRSPLVALLAANGLSLVGNQVTNLAIPWFVLTTTDSPWRAGLVGFAGLVPTIVAAFFGGAIVDRVGFKPTSVAADVASGLTVAAIPLLHRSVGLPFAALLVLVFLGALLDAPGGTARQSLLPELAELARWPLERANAAAQTVQGLGSLLGPPLAGLLIVLLGPTDVLWLDAVSFGGSALLVALAVPDLVVVGRERLSSRYLDDVREGLRALRRDRLLWTITLAATALNFLAAPLFGLLLAVYARQFFGDARQLGLLLAAVGGGTLVGALLYGALGPKLPRRPLLVGGVLVVGVPFWTLAALPPWPVVAAALAMAGVATGVVNPLVTTLLQERSPVALRGRLLGTLMAGALVASPAGVLLAGALVEVVGLRPLLVAMGGAFLPIVAGLWRSPAVRAMARQGRAPE